ncbi:hypothetical protein LX87_04214 [Larkinella arboricola]|uniref:Uncharacterized protein n=1 Tax=Larkinella arboricola TaxID=643671 RepID=A0A327WPN8_LARAB|nr:hypothetical protein [Larkinella arboricola]RAJ94328.1 hypothetical protein LX87_04214 [Larkinella arboricola]
MKRFLSIVFVLVAAFLDACRNPVENVELKFKDPLAVAVQVKYNIPAGLTPDQLTIKIAGPDAEKVVTTLNTRKFKLTSDGKLFLCLAPSTTPSASAPVRFNVVALSDKLVDNIQPVQLENTKQRNLTIPLLSKQGNNLPAQQSFKGNDNGTVQTTATVQTKTQANVSQATISVPQGSEIRDIAGNPVGGSLTITADPINNSTTAKAAADMPGKGIINASTPAGAYVGNQQILAVAGGVYITVYNDAYQLAKTFSKPIQIAFALNTQMKNPRTGKAIQVGDAIPLFSFDEVTNRWTQEQPGKVQRSASGSLEYVASISHLSLWVAAFTEEVCEEGPTFKFSSKYTGEYSGRSPEYRFEVIDQTGNVVQRAGGDVSFWRSINDGTSVRVTNLKKDMKVRLRLYDKESKMYVSPEIDACSNTEVLFDVKAVPFTPLPKPAPDNRKEVTISLVFNCGNQSVDPDKLPFKVLYAQYRASGSQDDWKDLPTLRWPTLSTKVLVELNKAYDLRAGSAPDHLDLEYNNYKVTSTNWPIKLTAEESKPYCKP